MAWKEVFTKYQLEISFSLSIFFHLLLFFCFSFFSWEWSFARELPLPIEVDIIDHASNKSLARGGRDGTAIGAEQNKSILQDGTVESELKRVDTSFSTDHLDTFSHADVVNADVSKMPAPKAETTQNAPYNLKKSSSTSDINKGSAKNISGTGEGSGEKEGSGSNLAGDLDGLGAGLGEGFILNGDGTYTATSSMGIDYEILEDAEAVYPDEARAIGYSDIVSVEGRILVGLDGRVESVEILNAVPRLGFQEEAIKALSTMVFAPIYYRGKNIKMQFLKTIHFYPS